jgi:Phenylalanyl-tRNA synthetase beta subunit
MPTISYSLEELIKGLNRSFTNEELNELLEMCKCELKQIKGDEIIGEITPERPDLFSTEGLIHFIKGILSIEKGPKRLVFIKENFKVKISERLKQVRPYVVIATVRGVKLTNEALRRIINYQEILHESWCRSRKKPRLVSMIFLN